MQLIRKQLQRLTGAFEGYGQDKVFMFINGEKWQQSRYKYKYKYKYRPKVKLWKDESKHYLQFDCMDEMIEVRRIV